MKRFKFKLQKVLDIRIRKEDLLKEDLAKLKFELELEKNKLQQIELSIQESEAKKIKLQNTAGVSSSEVIDFQNYIYSLLTQLENQKLYVLQAEEKVQAKLKELIIASKEKRIMERLKEKQHYEYLWELDQLEQKTMDEIATFMESRSNNQNKFKLSKLIE